METHSVFDLIAKRMNQEFRFPRDLELHFAEQGRPQYRDGRISLSYQFINDAGQALVDAGYIEPEQAVEAGLAVTTFVFYHELAHALIDVYDLPVVGREEDVADSLATVVAVEVVQRPEVALLAAGHFGAVVDPGEEFEEDDFLPSTRWTSSVITRLCVGSMAATPSASRNWSMNSSLRSGGKSAPAAAGMTISVNCTAGGSCWRRICSADSVAPGLKPGDPTQPHAPRKRKHSA